MFLPSRQQSTRSNNPSTSLQSPSTQGLTHPTRHNIMNTLRSAGQNRRGFTSSSSRTTANSGFLSILNKNKNINSFISPSLFSDNTTIPNPNTTLNTLNTTTPSISNINNPTTSASATTHSIPTLSLFNDKNNKNNNTLAQQHTQHTQITTKWSKIPKMAQKTALSTLSKKLPRALPYLGMVLTLPLAFESISESFEYLDDYLEEQVDIFYDKKLNPTLKSSLLVSPTIPTQQKQHDYSLIEGIIAGNDILNNNDNNHNDIIFSTLTNSLNPFFSATKTPSHSFPSTESLYNSDFYQNTSKRVKSFLSPILSSTLITSLTTPKTDTTPTNTSESSNPRPPNTKLSSLLQETAISGLSSPFSPLSLSQSLSSLFPYSSSATLLASKLRRHPDDSISPNDPDVSYTYQDDHKGDYEKTVKTRFPNGRPASPREIDDMTFFQKIGHFRGQNQSSRPLEWFQDPKDPYEIPMPEPDITQLAMVDDRPPYNHYDTIRHAHLRQGISPNEGRHHDYNQQTGNIYQTVADIWFNYQDLPGWEDDHPTRFKEDAPVQKKAAQITWDEDYDPDWEAAKWLVRHSTPRYRYEHRDKSIEEQGGLIKWGLQLPPPLWIDGVIYPTVDLYMAREGFYNTMYKGTHYNLTTPWLLFTLWTGISMKYWASQRFWDDQINKAVTSRSQKVKNPTSWWFDHFTLSYDNRHRIHTYFTSAHAHFTLPHLMMNSTALFATWKNLGITQPAPLFGMFTVLSFFSSLTSLAFTTLVTKILLWRGILRPSLLTPALGASGGLAGMIAINALTHPEQKLNLFFLPRETELIEVLQLMMTIDSIGFLLQCFGKSTGISHSGHLGGYLSGIIMYNWLKARYEIKYPPGTHKLYINWAENTLWPVKRNDVAVPTQDTTGIASRHISKMNSFAR